MNTRRTNMFARIIDSIRSPLPIPLVDRPDAKIIKLVEMLKSKDYIERAGAEAKLKKNRETARPYIQKLLRDPELDPMVRVSAISILGNPDRISNPPFKDR